MERLLGFIFLASALGLAQQPTYQGGGGSGTITGSGTTGQVAQFNGATSLTSSNTLPNGISIGASDTAISRLAAGFFDFHKAAGICAADPANCGLVALGEISAFQTSNGVDVYVARRFTDTSPTGDFLDFTDTLANTIFGVDVTGKLISGIDNSAAGLLQVANASANAHTIFASGATTSNTVAGPTTVPITGHLLDCTTASTTCTLTDSGVLAAQVLTASAPTNHGVLLGAGTQLAGVTAAGTTGQVLTGNTGADPTWQAAGGPTYSTASTPAAPTLATVGSAGSTTISYKVVGCQDTGCTLHTAASSGATIATANATLSSTNYVNLSAYLVHLDGSQCYNIYRTAAGGTPSTTGLIASCVGQEYSDQGAAGDSATAPSTNTTILVSNPFPLPGCAIAVGGLTGADAPPCTPTETDDEFNETSITLDPRWTWVNQNGASISQSNGFLSLTSASRGGDNLNCRILAAPSTPYTYVAKLYNNVAGVGAPNFQPSFGFYESGSGKIATFGSQAHTTNVSSYLLVEWTNTTTQTNFPVSAMAAPNPYWIKIQADGTNLIYSSSPDGISYKTQLTEAKAAFFTTAPNNIAICIDNNTNANILDVDYVRRTQ
jgi:hypothetical protein